MTVKNKVNIFSVNKISWNCVTWILSTKKFCRKIMIMTMAILRREKSNKNCLCVLLCKQHYCAHHQTKYLAKLRKMNGMIITSILNNRQDDLNSGIDFVALTFRTFNIYWEFFYVDYFGYDSSMQARLRIKVQSYIPTYIYLYAEQSVQCVLCPLTMATSKTIQPVWTTHHCSLILHHSSHAIDHSVI